MSSDSTELSTPVLITFPDAVREEMQVFIKRMGSEDVDFKALNHNGDDKRADANRARQNVRDRLPCLKKS
jgi:hypothetical protein